MRWAKRQRIAFIGECLHANGAVNRKDVMAKFGVSAPQAASDFRTFEEAHPGAMKYDPTRKAYVPDRMTRRATRDIGAAANILLYADDTELERIAHHDPSMIRDVAAALVSARG